MVELTPSGQITTELAGKTLHSILENISPERGFAGILDRMREHQIETILGDLGEGKYKPAFMEMESLARIWRDKVRCEELRYYSPHYQKALYLSGVSDALAKMIVEGQTADSTNDVSAVFKYLRERADRYGKISGQLNILDCPEADSNIRRLVEIGGLNLSDSGQKIPVTAESQH